MKYDSNVVVGLSTVESIIIFHLVDPPQVVKNVDVDCALPGAAGHPVPAPDAVGHQSHQIVSPAEPIPEMGYRF